MLKFRIMECGNHWRIFFTFHFTGSLVQEHEASIMCKSKFVVGAYTLIALKGIDAEFIPCCVESPQAH